MTDTEHAVAVLERFGDLAGLARGWLLHGTILFYLGHPERARPSFERASAAAKQIGDRRLIDQTALGAVVAATYGHMPTSEGIAVCEEVLEWAQDPAVRSMVLQKGARLQAAAGRVEAARAGYEQARSIALEYGLRLRRGTQVQDGALVYLAAGELETAERELREGIEILAGLGETGFRATNIGMLAETLLAQGRLDDAAAAAEEARALAQPDDFEPNARARCVLAHVAARRGDAERGLALAREAVALADSTEYLETRAAAQLALADVTRAANRPEEEAAAAALALQLYEQKGDVIGAQRVRAFLGEPVAKR
jgi:tetratricopeptide (TPR) repeat protein